MKRKKFKNFVIGAMILSLMGNCNMGFARITDAYYPAGDCESDGNKIITSTLGQEIFSKPVEEFTYLEMFYRDQMDRTILHMLARFNRSDQFEILLKKLTEEQIKKVLSQRDSRGATPLCVAASYGSLEVVKLLLSCGEEVDGIGDGQPTPLHEAALHGHYKVAKFLIEKGADVKARCGLQTTPLHAVACCKKCESDSIAKLLIEKGADVEARDCRGETPLHVAARYDNIFVAQLLFASIVDINARNCDGQTPLHIAAEYKNALIASKLLLLKARVNVRDMNGNTPMHEAAKVSPCVQPVLLDRRGDIECKNKAGATPLCLAAYSGDLDAVKSLIGRGANVRARDKKGATPLHYAALSERDDSDQQGIIQFLIDSGAVIESRDRNSNTALHLAVYKGRLKTVQLLIKNKAKINAKNATGDTLLHMAARGTKLEPRKIEGSGRTEQEVNDILVLLLQSGLDPYVTNDEGLTALQIVWNNYNSSAEKILLEHM